MKPYYEDALATIYHGDGRDVLALMPKSQTLVVTDPPYNIGYAYASYDDHLPTPKYREILRDIILDRPTVMSLYPETLVALGIEPRVSSGFRYGSGDSFICGSHPYQLTRRHEGPTCAW
jgi:hypothetical protein